LGSLACDDESFILVTAALARPIYAGASIAPAPDKVEFKNSLRVEELVSISLGRLFVFEIPIMTFSFNVLFILKITN
jgi:hypothetical protein